MHPAIQAKLQQAHNKLLGQSRPSNRQEETAASARPAASKPGSKAGQKGKANPQPQPKQGQSWLCVMVYNEQDCFCMSVPDLPLHVSFCCSFTLVQLL